MSMTPSPAGVAPEGVATLPLHAVRPAALGGFLASLPREAAAFLGAQHFAAAAQSLILLPGPEGLAGAVLGLGEDRSPFAFGSLPFRLPAGTDWYLMPGDYDGEAAELGFLLGAYQYDRLKPRRRAPARLRPSGRHPEAALTAEAIRLARDLINTPANLLGPAELADAALDLASRFGAHASRVTGEALAEGFPALAAVGAGSARAPQMVRFSWGDDPSAPLISLCGKGVCFDTGGYDLKPSAGMLRMKKDMGGAAIALGLAQLIMASRLPVRLDLRIGCVENSVSGQAMRPLDVLRTRAGLTVEVGNTDAEGRLVLADLLAEAAEAKPDWLIDFATLTGAARVALGPDIPALFGNDDDLAAALAASGTRMHDPLWRLPLWQDYAGWLDTPVADINNVGQKPFAGAIIAALFLNRFVPAGTRWAHIDTYAWNDRDRPGRPEGGEAQSLRAVFDAVRGMSRKPA
ncbi:MAG TPA: leucyl aminopeptidase family protein [Acetobacteraceae bacterium]|nr:leucyl aminopeptidase family protein [Acetobacteraceae bacterium]